MLCFIWINKPLRIGFLGSLVKVWGIPVYPDITYSLYSRDHPGIWLDISRSSHGTLTHTDPILPIPTNQATKQTTNKPNQTNQWIFSGFPPSSSHVSLCQGTVKILKSLTNSICPFTILVPMFKAYSYPKISLGGR